MRPLRMLAFVAAMFLSVSVLAGVVWLTNHLLLPNSSNPGKVEVTGPTNAETPKDYYEENPFNVSKRYGAAPKTEMDEQEFKFGVMVFGSTGEHDFVVRNVGDAPLKLAKGPSQCKCTLAGLKDQEIPPGGEGVIQLKWTPEETGLFRQRATVWTNDPVLPKIILIVEGQMSTEIVVVPKNGWSLGVLQLNTSVPLEGRISSSLVDDGKVLSVEASTERLKFDLEPITDETVNEAAKWGYLVRGTLNTGDTPGDFSEAVTFHTNVKGFETVTIPVRGVVAGAAMIYGPNWYAGSHLIDFGIVDSAKGKRLKFTLMVQSDEEELKFLNVEANPAFVKVELKPVKTGPDGGRERYALTVEIPPGSPKGIWPKNNWGKVLIKTNHKMIPAIDLNLEMRID